MKTAEERGREFLNFVGENTERLKRNLAKNINYDPEYFEDVFSYTILRIYDSILERSLEIQDYEQYFFQASRLNYIKISGRSLHRRNRHLALSEAGSVCCEDPTAKQLELSELKEELAPLFGAGPTDIFLRFMMAKSEGRMSYKKFAHTEGLSESYVSGLCGRIKKYLRN